MVQVNWGSIDAAIEADGEVFALAAWTMINSRLLVSIGVG